MATITYSPEQYRAEKAIYEVLLDMTYQMKVCETNANEANGEKLYGTDFGIGPVVIDSRGEPIEDANYWLYLAESIKSQRNEWLNAYVSLFPDNKERHGGRAICNRLNDSLKEMAAGSDVEGLSEN